VVYGGVEIHRVGDSTQQCKLSIYSPLSMMENLKTEHVHNIRGVFCDTPLHTADADATCRVASNFPLGTVGDSFI